MTERETHTIEEVDPSGLLAEVDALRLDRWRLVQLLCVSLPGGFELSYSFGGGYAMRTLRMRVDAKDRVPSVTPFYEAAFLYENEIRDLFGVRIERITPDWEGRVYGVDPGKPFERRSVAAISSERGTGATR
jgi:ech hydrogenase subunit D